MKEKKEKKTNKKRKEKQCLRGRKKTTERNKTQEQFGNKGNRATTISNLTPLSIYLPTTLYHITHSIMGRRFDWFFFATFYDLSLLDKQLYRQQKCVGSGEGRRENARKKEKSMSSFFFSGEEYIYTIYIIYIGT